MTIKARATLVCPFAALLLQACASQGDSLTTAAMPVAPTAAAAQTTPGAQTVSQLPKAGGYTMSPAEMELDCRKLTGRMAVRIVQVRDFQTRRQTTALSRTLQSTSSTMLGGSMEGTDPDGRYARDRAMLEAYNQRLAEKSCANFDLNAELAPGAKEPPRTRPLDKS